MIYQDLFDIIFARAGMDQEVKVSALVERERVSSAVETTDILFANDRLVATFSEEQVRQLGVE